MIKNNFLKYGKIFLSSVLISTYSSIAIPTNGGYFQGDNQTTMNFYVKNDIKSIENKLKSIGSNKDSIKNNLKIYSRDAITMQTIDREKKSGETFTTVKKIKTIPQKIFKAVKYLASSVVCGIGYIIKNKFFNKKPQSKFAKIDNNQPQPEDQKSEQTKVNSPFKNHSSFINYKPDDDDDDDDSKPPKFYPTKPKTPYTFTSDEDDEKKTTGESKDSDDEEDKMNNLPAAIIANNNIRNLNNNPLMAVIREQKNLSVIREASEEDEDNKNENDHSNRINYYITGINEIGERDPRVNSMNMRLLAESRIIDRSAMSLYNGNVPNVFANNYAENNDEEDAPHVIINNYYDEESSDGTNKICDNPDYFTFNDKK